MQFNQDPKWLQRMADAEDNCDVSVGSGPMLHSEFILDLGVSQSTAIDGLNNEIAHHIERWQNYLVSLVKSGIFDIGLPLHENALSVLHEADYGHDELPDFEYLKFWIYNSSTPDKIDTYLRIGVNGVCHHYHWSENDNNGRWYHYSVESTHGVHI